MKRRGASVATSRLLVQVRQRADYCQHEVAKAGGPDQQRLNQGGDLPQRHPPIGGARQQVFAGQR